MIEYEDEIEKLLETNNREIIENKEYKILWNFIIQYDIKVEALRPNTVVTNKAKKKVRSQMFPYLEM